VELLFAGGNRTVRKWESDAETGEAARRDIQAIPESDRIMPAPSGARLCGKSSLPRRSSIAAT
jgi:hypothetical protein